ncbi:MAG TPA: DUF6632 domain-containing protein [Myxococcota bacterium]|nr:DUF6632 domain-containing protein [Myxococcota bacterium]
MRIMGWGLIVAMALAPFVYAPGFLWGITSAEFANWCIGPAHPESPYDAFHPYVFMVAVLYLAWAILLIRGAKDPRANAALFDYGILANVLHASLMIPQAFIYRNEHAHMWADVPLLLAVSLILWIYHPNRVAPEYSRA